MPFHSPPLIAWTDKGLFCESGNFYIDPHRAVDVAVVTHAHSDHARRGSQKYICERSGAELLKTRLGKNILVEPYSYQEKFKLGDVTVSLHSAGHILGSAQVRVERKGEVWVASGDYKRDRDPSCLPFENVACDVFITEATFGTPKFVWSKDLEHGLMIFEWWKENARKGMNCILFGYSLGKAQRILAELAPFAEKPILIHQTISALTECYRQEGMRLAETCELQESLKRVGEGDILEGELILAPPSIMTESWIHKLGKYKTAFASGWMSGSGDGFRRGRYDHGFVMSDHADWNDLNLTIQETGAKRVFVQHRNGALVRHLNNIGIEAHPIETLVRKQFYDLGGVNMELF